MRVEWTHPGPNNFTGFVITVRTNNFRIIDVRVEDANARSHILEGLELERYNYTSSAGVEYFLSIVAFDSSGSSLPFGLVSTTMPRKTIATK